MLTEYAIAKVRPFGNFFCNSILLHSGITATWFATKLRSSQ